LKKSHEDVPSDEDRCTRMWNQSLGEYVSDNSANPFLIRTVYRGLILVQRVVILFWVWFVPI
jgi:hypothetical protein